MKNLYKLIVLSGMALFLGSCYYDTYPEEAEIPDEVSYSEDIQPIWTSSCVSTCHPPAPPDLREGLSYDALINGGYVVKGDARNSVLYKSLLGLDGVSQMPPDAQLSTNSIKLVEKWINDGAENN